MLYYITEISAETKEQAKAILEALLTKKLVNGGQIINAAARFLWKGELTNMSDYCTIRTFTIEPHKSAVIDTVKAVSVEEAPMITFTLFDDSNVELRNYIDREIGQK
jgi:uncharacterized protein involved in tolerance to divalent cations